MSNYAPRIHSPAAASTNVKMCIRRSDGQYWNTDATIGPGYFPIDSGAVAISDFYITLSEVADGLFVDDGALYGLDSGQSVFGNMAYSGPDDYVIEFWSEDHSELLGLDRGYYDGTNLYADRGSAAVANRASQSSADDILSQLGDLQAELTPTAEESLATAIWDVTPRTLTSAANITSSGGPVTTSSGVVAANLTHAGGNAIGTGGTSNLIGFFNAGYGPLLYRGVITIVTSSTEFTIGGPFGDLDGQLDGCKIVIHNDVDDHKSVRTIVSSLDSGGNTDLTIDSGVGFALATGAIVEILAG